MFEVLQCLKIKSVQKQFSTHYQFKMHYMPINEQIIIRYWIAANDYASPAANTKEGND